MEDNKQQPPVAEEKNQPVEFDINKFQEMLRTLQARKEQGRTFKD
jgi:hypothetical protein